MSKRFKNIFLPGVTIESAVAEGKCITRWQDRVVFVEGVAPGDVADIKIVRRKRNYLEAIPQAIVVPSPLRTTPFCSHFGTCGGCKWQHLAYEHQLEFKRQQVTDSLQRIGKVAFPEVAPTLASAETQFYRNKLEFTFSNRRWLEADEISSGEAMDRNGLGFHKPRQFDKVVDLKQCYLQPEPSNKLRLWLRDYGLLHGLAFYDIAKKHGFLRNLIIRTASTGEVMVIVQVGQHLEQELGDLLKAMHQDFPQITSLNYVINTKGNETFHDLPVVTFAGKDHIRESMEDLQFKIGPKSFYQTNSAQALKLYQLVRDLAELQGHETVYDLYCGTGTITLFLARHAQKVIGIEQVPEAIEDANYNATCNNIDNATFYTGDLKDVLNATLTATHGTCDLLVTDPPRAGMHENVVQEILQLAPKKLIYVSCNPATQARDLALMDEQYSIKAVHPVDMFPHTHHVESVVLLELRS